LTCSHQFRRLSDNFANLLVLFTAFIGLDYATNPFDRQQLKQEYRTHADPTSSSGFFTPNIRLTNHQRFIPKPEPASASEKPFSPRLATPDSVSV